MLLILHLEISLTNLEPLQPYFICLNCICSVITITITIFTLTTILTPEALIYLLLPLFASSPSPRPSQLTNSLHKSLSQSSSLQLVQSPGQTPFELFQINSDSLAAMLGRFGSSCISRSCKHAGIHCLLAFDSQFYSFCSLQLF